MSIGVKDVDAVHRHWLGTSGRRSIRLAVDRAAGDTIQFTCAIADGPFRTCCPATATRQLALGVESERLTGAVAAPLPTTTCSAADGITTGGDTTPMLIAIPRLPRLRAIMRRLSLGLPALLPSCLALAAGLGLAPITASAQSIGAYNPPVTWPERPRRFDLIHQRIAIAVDWSHLAINGQVQTTVVATTADRHGAARRRPPDDPLGHRREGQEAQVRGRHHARDRAHAEAAGRRRHGGVHGGLHGRPRARAVLRAAEPRGLDPGRGDRDPKLGADLRLPERQDHLGVPGHGRFRHVGALQREPRRRDAGPGRAGPHLGLGPGRSPPRPTSIPS